ncbi:MAG: hypothetical protein ACYTEL_13775 [Planctomycetota bacterium]
MFERRMLKIAHFVGTAWFILCVGYTLVLALREAGFHWWVIFSLSGHSAVVVFLLISMYLFAIFRGVARSSKIEVEHPLTSAVHYTVFYVVSPFLGSLAGLLAMLGEDQISQSLRGMALGTLGATFLVWVIVDPAVGLFEMLLPASRRHYKQRVALAKAERQERQAQRERFLAEVFANEEQSRSRWREALSGQAERLSQLLTAEGIDAARAEREAVDIGVSAWQMGGLSCMRELKDMAMALTKYRSQELVVVDYVSNWWDGIGSWRTPSFD